MLPIFFGLTAANLIVLASVFVLGLMAPAPAQDASDLRVMHIGLGIAAGLLAAFTHVTVFVYFMATSKWAQAATDKTGIDPRRFARPAMLNKRRTLPLVMVAIVLTMLAMFSGAAADRTVSPWWPAEIHMVMGVVAITANLVCALGQYARIRSQGRLMDEALAALGAMPGVKVQAS